MRGLTRHLRRRVWRWLRREPKAPGDLFRGYDGDTLRATWKHPGCPICRIIEDEVKRYYFWLINEQYYVPHTMDALKASYGFCRPHAWPLRDGPAYVVGVTYDYVLEHAARKLRDAYHRLSQMVGAQTLPQSPLFIEVVRFLQPEGPCPLCQLVEGREHRQLVILLDALADPMGRAEYEASSGLCLRHLGQALQGRVPEALLTDTKRRLKELRAVLTELEGEASRERWASIISRFVGPPLPVPPVPREVPSGTFDLSAALQRPGCLVCRAAAEGTALFLMRLGDPVGPSPELIERAAAHFGPCAPHAWRLLGQASLGVVATIYRTLLTEMEAWLDGLGRAEHGLLTGSPPKAGKPVELATPCALCEAAREREQAALEALTGILEDIRGEQLAQYRASYGLCLRHFPQALAVASDRVVKELVRLQGEFLRYLCWELGEYLPRYSWDFRYVAKGREQTAWRRAVERCAGTGEWAPDEELPGGLVVGVGGSPLSAPPGFGPRQSGGPPRGSR